MTNGTPSDLLADLRDGNAKMGVWGTGFIGYSTLANFANEGIECVGFDIDSDLVATINDGEVPIETVEHWLGFDPAPLVDEGLLDATTDYEELLAEDVRVHFVAIPTEREGEPWARPLRQTFERITESEVAGRDQPLVTITESTMTPGMTDEEALPIVRESTLTLGDDVLVGVAPRRDWFTSRKRSLPDIPRIYGGQNDEARAHTEEVLGIVVENLVEASDHRHAEMVKSVENAYRHVGITLANQLARAYPGTDVREVLRLAATKWNIPAYHPSVGIGGYCIPIASKYVLEGADRPDELSLLTNTVETDEQHPAVIADSIAAHGVESVAILGLAYKGDVKVDVLSPTKAIARRLRERGVDVAVNDPYYDDEYVEAETGVDSIAFPDDLGDWEAVVVAADHRQYTYVQNERILDGLDRCELVIDSPKTWDDIPFADHDIEYYYTGGKGWYCEPETQEASAQND